MYRKKIFVVLILLLASMYSEQIYSMNIESFFKTKISSHNYSESLEKIKYCFEEIKKLGLDFSKEDNLFNLDRCVSTFDTFKEKECLSSEDHNLHMRRDRLFHDLNRHFLEILELLLSHILKNIEINEKKVFVIKVPLWLDKKKKFSNKVSIQKFLENFIYSLFINYYPYSYKMDEEIYWYKRSFFMFYLSQVLHNLQYHHEDSFIESIKDTLSLVRNFLSKHDFTKNMKKLFKDLNIMDTHLIDECQKYEWDLFYKVNSTVYPAEQDNDSSMIQKIAVNIDDYSDTLVLSKRSLLLMTTYVKNTLGFHIDICCNQKELDAWIKKLYDSQAIKSYSGVIIAKQSGQGFLLHAIPVLVNRSSSDSFHFYSFDSIKNKANSLDLLFKNIENKNIKRSSKELLRRENLIQHSRFFYNSLLVQKDLYSCHIYSFFLLLMILWDIENNHIEIPLLLKIENQFEDILKKSTPFNFPLRWSSLIQRNKELETTTEKKDVNIIMLKPPEDYFLLSYQKFSQKYSQTGSFFQLIFNFEPDYMSAKKKKTKLNHIKTFYHQNILQKQAVASCLYLLGKALQAIDQNAKGCHVQKSV